MVKDDCVSGVMHKSWVVGTGGGTRTPKVLPPADFESAASTSSATPAQWQGILVQIQTEW